MRHVPIRQELLWVAVGQGLATLGSIAGIKLLTTILGPAEFGRFALGLTLVGLINLLIYGPLSQGVLRFYSVATDGGVLDDLFYTVRRAHSYALVVLAVMIGVGYAIAHVWPSPSWSRLVLAAGLSGLTSGALLSFLALLNAMRRRKAAALIQGTDVVVRVAFSVLFLKIFDNQANLALLGYGAGTGILVAAVYTFRYWGAHLGGDRGANKVIRRPHASQVSEQYFAYVAPFLMWAVFGAINQFSDRWILGFGPGVLEVGIYFAMYQIANAPILVVANIMNQFVIPIVYAQAGRAKQYDQIQKSDRTLRNAVLAMMLVMAFLLLVMGLLRDKIVRLLTTEAFVGGSHLLILLTVALSVFHLCQLLVVKGLKSQMPHRYIWPKAIQAATFLGLGIPLARHHGATGVAIAFVGANAIYLLVIMYVNAHIARDVESKYITTEPE